LANVWFCGTVLALPGYQSSAMRLARLLLADPLSKAGKWEDELADPKAAELAGGKSLLIKYVFFLLLWLCFQMGD
jgi:hypothetical protein